MALFPSQEHFINYGTTFRLLLFSPRKIKQVVFLLYVMHLLVHERALVWITLVNSLWQIPTPGQSHSDHYLNISLSCCLTRWIFYEINSWLIPGSSGYRLSCVGLSGLGAGFVLSVYSHIITGHTFWDLTKEKKLSGKRDIFFIPPCTKYLEEENILKPERQDFFFLSLKMLKIMTYNHLTTPKLCCLVLTE